MSWLSPWQTDAPRDSRRGEAVSAHHGKPLDHYFDWRAAALWLLVLLVTASLLSALVTLPFSNKPAYVVLANNAFGWGALALLDFAKTCIGWGVGGEDSWTPMIRAIQLMDGPNASRLYETLFFEEGTKFQYPPTSLLPLEALSLVARLSPRFLNLLNFAVLLANTVAVACLAWRASCPREHGRDQLSEPELRQARTIALLAGLGVWLFYPVTRAYVLGQIQLWIDLAFTLACILWLYNRRAAAGVAIGIASMIKPQLGFLFFFALAWKEWDFVRGFLLLVVPIAVISISHYGWHNHLEYLDVLSYVARHGESYVGNNSVNGLVNRALANGPNMVWEPTRFAPYHAGVHAATLLAGVGFLLIPLVAMLVRGKTKATVYDFGLAALCVTMASPVAWEHHYGILPALLVLAVGYAARSAASEARAWMLAFLCASWVLTASRYEAFNLLSRSPFNILQSYLFIGAALLLSVLFWLTWLASLEPAPSQGSRPDAR